MRLLSMRAQRIVLLLGLFVVSFALYPAAESGSETVQILLLGLLALLMVVTVRIG